MLIRIPDDQADTVNECLQYLCTHLVMKDSRQTVTPDAAAAYAIVKCAQDMEAASAPAMADFRRLMEGR